MVAQLDAKQHADRIRVNGYTRIPDLLPAATVVAMRDAFDRLLAEHMAANPSNRGANRYQMYLPFEPPFADPVLYENETAMPIVREILGPNAACVYFASDTPLPGSDYQRVHSDTQLLFPESGSSLPCYGLVLNIPLVDVTEENGPLEIWPGGTHLWSGAGDIATLAEEMPHERLTMTAGSAILRDLRMWHRGTPSRSVRSRPNLALVYVRPWYRFEQQAPKIPRSTWETLGESTQKLFRYAAIEPASLVDVREESRPKQARPRPVVLAEEKDPGDIWKDHARQELRGPSQAEIVHSLISELDSAEDHSEFITAGTRLAEIASDEAVAALIRHANEDVPFTLAAVDILSRCRHPSVVPTLVNLVCYGRGMQRSSAAYGLARLRAVEAIAPLCAIAANHQDPISNEARIALRQMGRPDVIAAMVLADRSLDMTDQARVLLALQGVLRFNAIRFLQRQNGHLEGWAGERVHELLKLVMNQTWLLRPSSALTDVLVQPASCPAESQTAPLLRPSSAGG